MRRIVKKNNFDEDLNINMTPFIDVIFSILVAFMIPNQTLVGNIGIQLPPAKVKIAVLEKDPIKVIIKEKGNIYINDKLIKFNDLVKNVDKISLKDKNMKIYVMADENNSYGFVLKVVGKLNEAGFNDVVLISDVYDRL